MCITVKTFCKPPWSHLQERQIRNWINQSNKERKNVSSPFCMENSQNCKCWFLGGFHNLEKVGSPWAWGLESNSQVSKHSDLFNPISIYLPPKYHKPFFFFFYKKMQNIEGGGKFQCTVFHCKFCNPFSALFMILHSLEWVSPLNLESCTPVAAYRTAFWLHLGLHFDCSLTALYF